MNSKCMQLGLLVFATAFFSGAAMAQAPEEGKLYFTPKVGFSFFTGIAGLEVQKNHWAFDVGIFPSGGVRYYFRPQGHSWFVGLFGSGIGYDNDETKDNIAYHHYSTIEGGGGMGYRWMWHSRWNLELGATVGYREEYWTNDVVKRTDKSIAFTPLATVGFSF